MEFKASIEDAEKWWAAFWSWLTGIRNWFSPEGVIAISLLIIALLLCCSKVLEFFLTTSQHLKRLGWWHELSPEQRNALRHRQQFAKVVRADLEALAKSENWNDQYFTDLEAEIEAEGYYFRSELARFLGRKSRGLRRVSSLMRAIETSPERNLLVVGEPGSGKSVALRHLGHELAERAIKSRDPREKIPLYINLKELPVATSEEVTADMIKHFVIANVRRGDADTAAFVSEKWLEFRDKGIWFFLFDSFDEIPAVLHAPSDSGVIGQHGEAIRRFLDGLGTCRGIVASREFKGPGNLQWQKFRILPLNKKRQAELIENSFLDKMLKDIVRHHLAGSSTTLQYNPMFLTLLCRYVKDEKQAPKNDHDLLERHIIRLARRDPQFTFKHYRLAPEQLLEGAVKIATLFAENPTSSLAPTENEIEVMLPRDSIPGGNISDLLSALIDVKIGRSDVPGPRTGDRRFTFAHRRYQETLFVIHLARNPTYLSAKDLLTNIEWREYAVTLLQSQTVGVIAPLFSEATSLLRVYSQLQHSVPILDDFGGHLRYFEWDADQVVPLLSLLLVIS